MLLSVCLLLKDEAEALRRIAISVREFADELIVVCDDPVSDSIQQAAKEFGARVTPHVWRKDFAAARNAGLEAARGEWVFWMDSDETLLAPDAVTIRELLGHKDVLAGYVTIEDETGATKMSPRRHPSIYRRRDEIRYVGRIHEHFDPLLPALAATLGMTVFSAPIRLRHTGYKPEMRPRKLQRNIELIELELADRPGQLYYMVELGRLLLLTGNQRGHAVLAEAARTLIPLLPQSQPPTPLAAALLEYALSHAPQNFPLTRPDAVAAAARWFPSSPPLLWRTARRYYEQQKFAEAAGLLNRILEMGETGRYDDTFSFDERIFGDETRLNLGVCCAKTGQIARAKEQFKLIAPGSPFHAMAMTNLKQL